MAANEAAGSFTTWSAGSPIRVTRMVLRSSNVKLSATDAPWVWASLCRMRPGQGVERGQLRARGLAPRGQEEIGQMEVAPGRGTEARGDDHVGQGGMAHAGVHLGEVHHLEQGV